LTTDKYREGTSDYCKACRTCCSWYLFIVHVRTISNLRQNQSPAQLGKDSHRSSSRSHNTSRRRLCLSLALRVRPQSHRIQRPGSVTMLLIMEMSTGMTTWQACSVGGSASLMFFQSFRAASVPEQLNWYRLKPPELSHPNTAGRGTQCCGGRRIGLTKVSIITLARRIWGSNRKKAPDNKDAQSGARDQLHYRGWSGRSDSRKVAIGNISKG
jgi:hypothetical protein